MATISVLACLGLAAGGLIALDRSETIESQYESFAAASEGRFGTGGWMPDYVPPSATQIRAAQNLDTNRQWICFRLPPEDLASLLAQGTRVTTLPGSRAPFWLSWWPGDIEGRLRFGHSHHSAGTAAAPGQACSLHRS